MKTIEIEDSLYDQLMALAQEVATQDNRCTASPYIFQIQTDLKVWDSGLNGNVMFLFNCDGEEIGEFNRETLDELILEGRIETPDWLDDLGTFGIGHIFLDDWFEENDLRLSSYSITHKYENAFLTEKACKEHIKRNDYHYSNPRDYLSHAFRNPELELVFNFLRTLQNEQKTIEPKVGTVNDEAA